MPRESVIKRFYELGKEGNKLAKRHKVTRSYPIRGFMKWQMSCRNILEKTFGKDSQYIKSFSSSLVAPKYNIRSRILLALGVLDSAKEEIEKGFLYKVEHLVAEDFYGSMLEQAKSLLENGHKIPAAVLGRIVIENTLKNLGYNEGIAISNKKASILNTELRKSGVYNLHVERKIQAHLDVGNYAAHGNSEKFDEKDLEDMFKFIEEKLMSI